MLPTLPLRRIVAGAALAVAAVILASTSAPSAPAPFHLTLVRAEPAVNGTVASPQQLKLWFSESIEQKGTTVKLTNAQSEAVKLGKISVDTAALAPAVVAVPATLAAGKYTVSWSAAGDDDHPSTGKFSFIVK